MLPSISRGLRCVRRLLSISASISPLLLCVSLAWTWARSYRAQDVIRWSSLWDHGSRQLTVRSSEGRLEITWDRLASGDSSVSAESAALSLPWGPGMRWETTAEPKRLDPAAPPWAPSSLARWGFGFNQVHEHDAASTSPAGGPGRTAHYHYYDLTVPVWPFAATRLRFAGRPSACCHRKAVRQPPQGAHNECSLNRLQGPLTNSISSAGTLAMM